MRVSPGIVWGNFLPTLAAATERYGVQQLLIGRMRAETYGQDTFYSGDWQIAFANDLEPVTSNFSGLSAAQVANLGTELATTYFAPPMTIFLEISSSMGCVLRGGRAFSIQANAGLLSAI